MSDIWTAEICSNLTQRGIGSKVSGDGGTHWFYVLAEGILWSDKKLSKEEDRAPSFSWKDVKEKLSHSGESDTG